MYEKQAIGKWGEDLACVYLEKSNYNILERNFCCAQGELDIVAYDIKQKEIVFIEVKTRTNLNYGFPSEAVNRTKKKHMKRCMEYYIYIRNLQNYYIRVDVIEIVVRKGQYKLNHLKNVEL